MSRVTVMQDEKTPALVLTKPTKATTAKLEINGLEDTVAVMRERARQMAALKSEQEADETTLLGFVRDERNAAEDKGYLFKTVLVNSADKSPVQVIFKNAFKQIDMQHEPQLREYLKETYDTLFETKYEVKLRDPTSIDKLRAMLGDDFDTLFSVVPYIAPKPDFMERKFQMRTTLTQIARKVLKLVIDQVQYKPQVMLK